MWCISVENPFRHNHADVGVNDNPYVLPSFSVIMRTSFSVHPTIDAHAALNILPEYFSDFSLTVGVSGDILRHSCLLVINSSNEYYRYRYRYQNFMSRDAR